MTSQPSPAFPMAPLLALSSAYFMVGTSSLCVIGLVLPISEGLGVSVPDVAFLVTIFALSFAITAPTAQVLLSKYSRVRILCSGMVIMVLGMALAATAQSYLVLFLSRAVLGIGCAMVSPMCSAIGAGMVAPQSQGRAMGVVFSGLTIATVIGVPLSAYIGTAIGWRSVMVIIAVCAVLSMTAILVLVKDRRSGAPLKFSDLFATIRQRRPALLILTTMLQMAAILSTFSLIAPYMIDRFHVAPNQVFLMLLIYGSFGIFGNILAGYLSDRLGPERVIMISLAGTTIAFLALMLVGPNLWVGMVILCLWSVTGMIFHTPQQQRMANFKIEQRSLMMALNAAAVYVGMSVGSWASRAGSIQWGYEALPGVSAFFMVACALVFIASTRTSNQIPDEKSAD